MMSSFGVFIKKNDVNAERLNSLTIFLKYYKIFINQEGPKRNIKKEDMIL